MLQLSLKIRYLNINNYDNVIQREIFLVSELIYLYINEKYFLLKFFTN